VSRTRGQLGKFGIVIKQIRQPLNPFVLLKASNMRVEIVSDH
jgi:hypothetical protein